MYNFWVWRYRTPLKSWKLSAKSNFGSGSQRGLKFGPKNDIPGNPCDVLCGSELTLLSILVIISSYAGNVGLKVLSCVLIEKE